MRERESERELVIRTYRRRARRYDGSAKLYYALGYPQWSHRRRAVNALGLESGDTVVEIGCGTGLNFELLQAKIGPAGRIVGVDLTDAMLHKAQQRVDGHRWDNVSLVQADARDFALGYGVNAVLSTYALTHVPECAEVIAHGREALVPGGRWVVLETKLPDNAPGWTTPLALAFLRPFAVTDAWAARRPWEAIRAAMNDNLADVSWDNLFLGFVYLASGRASTIE